MEQTQSVEGTKEFIALLETMIMTAAYAFAYVRNLSVTHSLTSVKMVVGVVVIVCVSRIDIHSLSM